jgi:hypothetical protein
MNNTTSTTNTCAPNTPAGPTAAPNKAPQKKRTVRRVPTFTTDESGRALVLVPLPDQQQHVRILREDFFRITRALRASDQWQENDNGKGTNYIRVRLPKERPAGIPYLEDAVTPRQTHAVIARLVLKVPSDRIVRYRDGDRLNLVRENLYTEEDDSPRPGKKPAHPMNVKKFAQSVLRFDPD